jgi:superoxide dismutase, Cu-Zn family
MNGRRSWYCAALIGASAIGIGCAPDGAERDAADRSRSGSTQPPSANREAIRPPTATTSPAAPGAAAPPPTVPPRLMARAEVRPLGDNTVRGIVEFQTSVGAEASDAGPVTINVRLMGLDAGPHGMHVHVGTDCTTPGTHLNPLNSPHGAANAGAAARHLGDLGNITADASGMVDEMLRDSLLSGDASFVGKVLIVHKGQDDLTTQPDGGAGDPVACGVIEAAEDVLSEANDSDREV